MIDYGLFPIAALLLGTFIYLARLDGSRAMRLWAWGFASVFATGVVTAGDAPPPGWALGALFTAAFTALMYAGSLVFAGRAVPRWLVPATAALGIGRAGLILAGYPTAPALAAIVFSLALFTAAGWAVWRATRKGGGGFSERALGPALVLCGGFLAASIGLVLLGIGRDLVVVIWVSAASAMGLLQILAGFERLRDQERERTRELERERRTLRAVFEASPLDIVLRGEAGRITMLNRAAAVRLGRLMQAAGRATPSTEIPPELLSRMLDSAGLRSLRERIEAAPDCVIENVDFQIGKIGDENEQTLQLFSNPVATETGEVLGRLWISRDVTRERDLQRQLIQSQKMEPLGTLAGGVAHDFNNQLTTILGNVRIAREETPADREGVHECLSDLERAAEHCARLTHGLLAFARRAPMKKRALAVEPLIGVVEGLLRAMLADGISLRVELGRDLWQPEADSTQLEQVVLNLAINARDAIDEHGEIRIHVRNRRLDGVRKLAWGDATPGRYVEFAVHDTGRGIDAAVREHIFEPFFTTKPTGQGTGLGLAIVYGVVSSHGGWLDIESRPGDTTISACFPAAQGGATAASPSAGVVLEGSEGVLLVDDESALRRLARNQLEDFGYRVFEAESGDRALELLRAHPGQIEVAVLDYNMPDRDGLDTLVELRRLVPELPAVIVSGHVDEETWARRQVDVELLPKPFRAEALAGAVRRALEPSGPGPIRGRRS